MTANGKTTHRLPEHGVAKPECRTFGFGYKIVTGNGDRKPVQAAIDWLQAR